MSVSETQRNAWRLHRRRGEAYPYYCAIASTSLEQFYSSSGLNVSPALPAGSVIFIGGLPYVTRNTVKYGQWGEIDPIEWHPSYIMPKKSADTFTDRAAVYWDSTNNYATSTAASNQFIGYAVSNSQLGSATNASSSSINLTGTAPRQAATVTSATSADGLVGGYTSGDTYIEVEIVNASTVNVAATDGPWQTTAAAGANLATATALPAGATLVSGGNNAVGVKLVAGQATLIKNTGTGGLFVYPPSGGYINAYGANNSCNMATLTVARFIPTAANSSIFYSDPTLAT